VRQGIRDQESRDEGLSGVQRKEGAASFGIRDGQICDEKENEMEVPTIEMNRFDARRKFLEYRAAVRERHNAEDEAMMKAYRALSQGKQVIHIGQVLTEAGIDHHNRPRLAICRSDASRVYFSSFQFSKAGKAKTSQGEHEGGHVFASVEAALWDGRRSRERIVIPRETYQLRHHVRCEAAVPAIPPGLRPRGSLENYYTLWDVKWEPKAPVDPILLKPISPMLFAIVAMWDLTPLERAIVAGQRLA